MTIRRTWRIADIEKALKEYYGNIAIIAISDMIFFDYYNNHFDGYWFKIYDNARAMPIVGIIIEGMDSEDFHIEESI